MTDPEADVLRLLHWNIHSWVDPDTGGSNVDAVIQLIREHAPHAVSLVEVDETWSEPSALARVAAATGYTPVFAPAFEYGPDEPAGGFGNAILTRLPILAVSQRQLTWPDSVYDRTEPSEPRILLLVTVEVAHPMIVGSTHLPRRDTEARSQGLKRIKVIAASLGLPWAICGDFNTTPDSWIKAEDQMAIVPDGEPTAPTNKSTDAIDYVIAPAHMPGTANVLEAAGSDHLAALVNLASVAPRTPQPT